MNSKNPKVRIPSDLDGEGRYVFRDNEWDMTTIRDATIGLEVFDLQLAALDLSVNPWSANSFALYLYHCNRIEKANLKYPIILDPTGFIIDGWHRVAKAILKGNTTIKAIKLNVMPEPDVTKIKE